MLSLSTKVLPHGRGEAIIGNRGLREDFSASEPAAATALRGGVAVALDPFSSASGARVHVSMQCTRKGPTPQQRGADPSSCHPGWGTYSLGGDTRTPVLSEPMIIVQCGFLAHASAARALT